LSGYLLDTDTISMFSPGKADASQAFAEWLGEQEKAQGIYFSAVTINEIEKGVHLLQRKGATAKAAAIRFWLLGLIATYSYNILPLSTEVAMISGQLEALALASGHNPGATDAMIAGTAKFHGLSIITHNLRHFQLFDVDALSPDQVST
jgi:predicted nucleic acid-binding protein